LVGIGKIAFFTYELLHLSYQVTVIAPLSGFQFDTESGLTGGCGHGNHTIVLTMIYFYSATTPTKATQTNFSQI